MIRSRKPSRPQLQAYTRQLRLEALEDRAVPATLFVDDSLVAGTALASLPASIAVTNDRDTSGTLSTGDEVSIAVGETGQTVNLTFNAAPASGDDGSVYSTISAAIAAATAGDTIEVAKGTYAESLTINKALTIDGLTDVAADVVIDPTSGDAVTISVSGVTLSDLTVTGAVNGITASGITGALTLDNVSVTGNTGIGLNLTGTGGGATLTLTDVSVTNNTGGGLTLSGFTTTTATGTLALNAGGTTAVNATLSGTSLQIGGQTIDVSGLTSLNLTGSPASDTFTITAPVTGDLAITIAGGGQGAGIGDVLDLTTVPTGATVSATFTAGSGFSGSISSGTTATINFSGIESFTDGSTLSGTVTNAANAGVAGVTAFIDANGNAALDAGEISATTNASGQFSFPGLPPGTYTVLITNLPSGTTQTSQNPAAVTITTFGQATSPLSFTVSGGATGTAGGTVSGTVFNDANKNGILDSGETGVSGVTVFLDADSDGTLDAGEVSVTSGTGGTFTLTSATNGQFTLRAVASGSFTGSTSTAVNLTGGVTITANVGLQNVAANTGGTVTGVVFSDTNGNGILDSGENPVSGVTVFLDLNGNGQRNAGEPSAVSSSTGSFTLTSTQNGQFAVRAVAPTGFTSGAITTVVLSGGAPVTANVALQTATGAAGGTVTGVVFADTDRDGVRDAGEALQSGVTVFLDADGDNTLDSGEVSTTTNASGAFSLTSTTNGTFTVRVVEPAGFTSSTDPVVTLTNGTNKTADVGLLTTAASGGTVTGIVFNDKDRDGTMDQGDNPVSGVTVFLDANGNGRLDAGEVSDTTDANGVYTLTTTTNGQVTVSAVLPVGYLRLSETPTVDLTGGVTETGENVGLYANLPPQATPARRLAAGFIKGGKPHVKVFDDSGSVIKDIDVSSLVGSAQARVAVADVTGDGVDDIIIGSGPGVPNKLVVLDGTDYSVAFTTNPFEANFTGGIYVVAGDVTGDGLADIIVTPDQGGGPRVQVFRGGDFAVVNNFFGIEDSNFRGGARAAVADINNDGVPDIIVAAGFGGGPRVAVFDGNSIFGGGGLRRLFNDFFAFEPALRNGAFVTAGDIDGDGFADLISGGGPGGGPRVTILSGADMLENRARVLANFFAGDTNNRGGIRLTAKDLDGDDIADLVVGDGDNAGKRITAYKGKSLRSGNPEKAFEINDNDDARGVYVG